MNAVIYDTTDGRILRCVSAPISDVQNQLQNQNEAYIVHDVVDDTLTYVLSSEVVDKPLQGSLINKTSATVGELITLSSLPIPCEVYVDNTIYEVPDGELILAVSLPGTIEIVIKSFPYLDKSFTVDIT